jgi:hypothetical protein
VSKRGENKGGASLSFYPRFQSCGISVQIEHNLSHPPKYYLDVEYFHAH